MGFFREELSNDVRTALGASATAPLIVADGFVTLESSGRRASNVLVYGVDERFWKFHGLDAGGWRDDFAGAGVGGWRQRRRRAADAPAETVGSPDRVALRPQGGHWPHRAPDARRRAPARPARRVLGEAAADRRPRGVRAARRLQRDLGVPGQVNTILDVRRRENRREAEVGVAARGSWRARDSGPGSAQPSPSTAPAASSPKPSRPRRARRSAGWGSSRFLSSPISPTRSARAIGRSRTRS